MLKLLAVGRIVCGVWVDAHFPPPDGFNPRRILSAVHLVFWLFYLKERVTDGKQAGTEHTRFIPQHR